MALLGPAACSLDTSVPQNLMCVSHRDCAGVGGRCVFDPQRGLMACCSGPSCPSEDAAAAASDVAEDAAGDGPRDLPAEAPAADVTADVAADVAAGSDAAPPDSVADAPSGPDAPYEVMMPDRPPAPDAPFGTPTLNLGSVPIGGSLDHSFEVDGLVLSPGRVRVTGEDADQFQIPDVRCSDLRCRVEVRFSPRAPAGTKRALLDVEDPVRRERRTAWLEGRAVEAVDGGPSTAPDPSACPKLASIWCARARACTPFTVERMFGKPEECSAGVSRWCTVTRLEALWTAETFERCAFSLAALSCEEWRSIPAVLKSPACFVPGPGARGGACANGAECASGRCRQVRPDCGVCDERVAAEGACRNHDDCAWGLVCVPQGRCRGPAALGQPCDEGRPCRASLQCAGGTCAPLGVAGAPCDSDAACDVEAGLGCNLATRACGQSFPEATWNARKPDGTVDRCRDGGTPLPGGSCGPFGEDYALCGRSAPDVTCQFPARCQPGAEVATVENPDRCQPPTLQYSCGPPADCNGDVHACPIQNYDCQLGQCVACLERLYPLDTLCQRCLHEKCCGVKYSPDAGLLETCTRTYCASVCR